MRKGAGLPVLAHARSLQVKPAGNHLPPTHRRGRWTTLTSTRAKSSPTILSWKTKVATKPFG